VDVDLASNVAISNVEDVDQSQFREDQDILE
jgi:hypothetical protein